MALTIILISVLYQVATRRRDRDTVRDTGNTTLGFLTSIIAVARDCLDETSFEIVTGVHHLLEALTTGHFIPLDSLPSFKTSNPAEEIPLMLKTLALCRGIEILDACIQYQYFINAIVFAAQGP